MKLGISGQALGGVKSLEQIVKIGSKYDINTIELWPCNADGGAYTPDSVANIKALLRQAGASACCVTSGAAFDTAACESPESYAPYLISAIDAAAELGAPVVNHYCFNVSLSDTPDFTRLEAYFEKPLAHARKKGIVLALENEAHDSTATPEKMLAILKYFDDPFFKTNFDAVNYVHASCEGFPWAYQLLKPYIGYVHIKNACLYNPDICQPEANRGSPMSGYFSPRPIQYATLPNGCVNIPALLTALEQDGDYHGACTLEPHTTPEHVEEFYAEESAWLRKLGFFTK